MFFLERNIFLLEGCLLQQGVLEQGQVLIAAASPDTRVMVSLRASAPSLCPAAPELWGAVHFPQSREFLPTCPGFLSREDQGQFGCSELPGELFVPAGPSVLLHPLAPAAGCTAVLHCACLAASLSLLLPLQTLPAPSPLVHHS